MYALFFIFSEDMDLRKQMLLPLVLAHIFLILTFIMHGTIPVRKPSAALDVRPDSAFS